MRVHFVAVAGTGMGALAGLFRSLGHDVSGSDVAFYPPMGPALRDWGIRLVEGFDPAHLDDRPDLVVIGNVCRPTNPEARAAIDRGLPYLSMAHALGEHVLPGTSPLVVGGTHGKTTLSTLCAYLLDRVGRAPGFLLGGIPKDFAESFRAPAKASLPRVGDADLGMRRTPFVVEGDEYDTAFFEKTPKFWHYRPEVGIVTSIEHDHVDIYPTEASYVAAFEGFVERIPESGLLVAHAADARVVDVAKRKARCEIAWYALEGDDTHGQPPHWLAAPVGTDENGQSFDLYAGGVFVRRGTTRLWGRHNLRNVTGALGACAQGYGAPLAGLLDALTGFRGVKRRQELIHDVRGVRVFDDFAHHPTAVKETIGAVRAAHGSRRIFAVFEPRSATACRAMHQIEYESAFSDADRVILAPVGRPELPPEERLDVARLAKGIAEKGTPAEAAESVDGIVSTLARDAKDGDVILLLSNGAFGGIYEKLRAALTERGAAP